MKTDHDLVEDLLNQALALGPDQRPVFLAAACGSDKALLENVESLLKAYGEAGGFLPETAAVQMAPATEGPGTVIDKYKLLEKLGEGGCGVVYMAEQEAPVRRNVALKVIKLGMDTRQVVARFEAERQALALMDHANIAKVLDAGATPAGRPYFVMELVGGIKITDYCEQNQLETRQRLDLFIQVCHAIQHAHQKGVIHRDIKPSNVLVASRDGVPVPKVIDFGIAKATQGRLTDDTVFTAFEQFLGTPAYMSPEQAQLGGVDVDTRSDIYSLGVLLYELLTGKTPFDAKELLAAGVEAMRRTIQEKEPPTPSTRLKQELVARSTHSGNSALCTPHSALDKDLDWIVLKCLEKDRVRRYETANGLARDIQRHLNSEPVAASPPSRLYRFKKFVRRNKTTFTAATVVSLVLVSGAAVSTWQAVRATLAEREQSRLRKAAQAAQTNESRERQKAQAALTQMEAIEIRRAEEYYEDGDRRNMLPYLALVLRQNPTNRIAAERLLSTLSHRHWARLACPPLMHSNRVTSAMFSRDGRRVVTSSADNTAWVWDAATGERVAGPFTHGAEINTAEFSPDGQLVVTASDDNTSRVWDARTGRPLTDPITHPARVELARFSPDNQTFVTLCDDRAARLFDAHSGRSLLAPLRHGDGPNERRFLREVDFSPDGTLLATASKETGTLRVWRCQNGEEAYKLESGVEAATCVRFSPDGRLLATSFYTNGSCVWDLSSSLPRAVQLPQQGPIYSIEFSPEGQRVVTLSSNGTAQVWDAVTGRPIGAPLRHGERLGCALFSPEGLRIVTASRDQTIRVWDAETGQPLIEPMQVENGAFYSQFHPDGQRVLSASNGKSVLVWWVSGVVSRGVHAPFKASCVEFSQDSRKVLVGEEQGEAQIWEPLTTRLPTVLSGHGEYVTCAAFSADGNYVATGSSDDTLRLWAVSTGAPAAKTIRMWVAGANVRSVQFSSDSRRVLAATVPGFARLWQLTSGEPASPKLGEEDGVIAAQLSPDGKWVATGGTNGTARIWDSMTGRPVSALKHDGPVLAVRFSPDSRQLLTGSTDKTARLWAVPSGEPLAAPIQHTFGLGQVRFSADGSRFLTVVTDRPSVRVRDSGSAKLLTEVFAEGANVADFSPDGRRVVTGSSSGTVQLRDAESGERLSEPLSRLDYSETARISPDGHLLASVSRTGPVQFWEVTPPSLPVPVWLPELAEALAGQRFNQQGLLEPVLPVDLWAVQERLTAWLRTNDSQPNAAWFRWAKWFISTPDSRSVLPSSPLTLAQYARSLAEQRVSPAAAREALLLQPTNVVAMVALAQTTTNAPLADWLSRHAMELAPDSQDLLWARESLLRRSGRFQEAIALLEQHRSAWAENPWIWGNRGESLAKLGRLSDSLADYNQAVSIARITSPDAPAYDRDLRKALVHNLLIERWSLLKKLNRDAEAQKDFLEANHIPARADRIPTSGFFPIDLRLHLNEPLETYGLTQAMGATNSTASLPVLHRVPFELSGCVRVAGGDADPVTPSRVKGIRVGQLCRTLHFLQSCGVVSKCEDDVPVGSYLIRYDWGGQEEIPILYGQNTRGWWDTRNLQPGATEAWSGTNDHGHFVRLIKFSWQNPHPETEIQTIDFVANRPDVQPILLAITAEQ